MKKSRNTLIIFGIIIVLGLLLKLGGLLDITGGSVTHHYNLSGYPVSVTGLWNDGSGYARYDSCKQVLLDRSNNGSISVFGEAPSLGSQCNYGLGAVVRVDADLREFQTCTITRTASMSASGIGVNTASVGDTINGQNVVPPDAITGYGTAATFSPSSTVFITNKGSYIEIVNGKTFQVSADKPVFFEEGVGAGSNGAASLGYGLSRIDCVPKAAPSSEQPVTVCNGNCGSGETASDMTGRMENSTRQPTMMPSSQWYLRVWLWIKGVFSY